jgi:YaaC-like protein
MIGFAKALVTAKSLRSLATMKKSHGVRDISKENARIADLNVHIDRDGTFQEFNDLVAPLTRLRYVDNANKGCVINIPSNGSKDLVGLELSLREILSRVPGIDALYRMTFGEHPNNEPLSIELSMQAVEEFRLRIDDKELFQDRNSLKEIVSRLRKKFPFLCDWRLTSAQRAEETSWSNLPPYCDKVSVDFTNACEGHASRLGHVLVGATGSRCRQ